MACSTVSDKQKVQVKRVYAQAGQGVVGQLWVKDGRALRWTKQEKRHLLGESAYRHLAIKEVDTCHRQ